MEMIKLDTNVKKSIDKMNNIIYNMIMKNINAKGGLKK